MADDTLGILNAFMHGETQVEISVADQKRAIIDKLNLLHAADKKEIAELLIISGHKSILRECSEGLILNLDQCPSDVLRRVYDLLTFKLDKRK